MKKLFLFFLLIARPSFAVDATTVGACTLLATMKNISTKVAYTGDDNANNSGLLEYKESASSTWLTAYTPYNDRRVTIGGVANPHYKEFRGSIVGLTASTAYDVRLTFTDVDGVTGTNPVTCSITTYDDTPTLGGSTLSVTDDATLATALGSANPGDTIDLAAGTYANFTVSRSGTTGAWIKIKGPSVGSPANITGAANQNVLISANYIVVEYLTFPSSNFSGVIVSAANHDIIAQHLTMDNISALCANSPTGGHYGDSGLKLSAGGNQFALNNTIHSTALSAAACSTDISPIYDGPGVGVFWANCVTCVADGNTIDAEVRDCVTGDNASDVTENIDIINNTCSKYKDDGPEAKGTAINVRIGSNTITLTTTGIGNTCIATNSNSSTAAYGPIYVYRNTCYSSVAGAGGVTTYKMGGGAAIPAFFFHNSVDTHLAAANWDGYANCGGVKVIKNNILLTKNGVIVYRCATGDVLDYNVGYQSTNSNDWAYLWNATTTYHSRAQFVTGTSQDTNSKQTNPLFLSSALDIDATSPAYNAGVSIANFNDSTSAWPYAGAGPDIGAYEVGGVPAGPILSSVTASSGAEGATVAVTLAGLGFQGGNAVVTVSGAGVTVSNTVIVSDTSITADFAIGSTAAVGARNVTVTTDIGASNTSTFTVTCTSASVAFSNQPTGTGLGLSLGTVIVQVRCGDSTVNTASTASIVLAKDMAATWGTLVSGSSLTKSATAGVATWTDLSITTTTGTGSITAASSGLTGATSDSITITQTPASNGMRLRIKVKK